jgi:hypothetical protein
LCYLGGKDVKSFANPSEVFTVTIVEKDLKLCHFLMAADIMTEEQLEGLIFFTQKCTRRDNSITPMLKK